MPWNSSKNSWMLIWDSVRRCYLWYVFDLNISLREGQLIRCLPVYPSLILPPRDYQNVYQMILLLWRLRRPRQFSANPAWYLVFSENSHFKKRIVCNNETSWNCVLFSFFLLFLVFSFAILTQQPRTFVQRVNNSEGNPAAEVINIKSRPRCTPKMFEKNDPFVTPAEWRERKKWGDWKKKKKKRTRRRKPLKLIHFDFAPRSKCRRISI